MQSLIPPFDAYEGDKPYVFVSYAHKNSDIVYNHISKLHDAGFRIWYDEGIDPGADWSDEIATALQGCAVFLVFISEASLASHNVRKEIIFAIDQRKHMLCVHIEEVELPIGLKMQLGNIQALLETRFHDKEKFYQRLHEGILPAQTLRADNESYTQAKTQHITVKPATPSAPRKDAEQSPTPAKSSKKMLIALLITISIFTAACVGYMWTQQNGIGTGIQTNNTVLEQALRSALNKPNGELRIEDLASYTGQLDLSHKNLTNIDLLRHMKQVTFLTLDNNTITDISPLAQLPSLVVVGLANNQITDISPLHASKNSLIGLSLDNNPIKDMKQLRAFGKLEVLSIKDVLITDLDLGRYLRRLKTVFVTPETSSHGLSEQEFWGFKYNLPTNCAVKTE